MFIPNKFCTKETLTYFLLKLLSYFLMTYMKPVFDKRIFWDVDFENLDYDKKARFVIERVFERGDVPDIRTADDIMEMKR